VVTIASLNSELPYTALRRIGPRSTRRRGDAEETQRGELRHALFTEAISRPGASVINPSLRFLCESPRLRVSAFESTSKPRHHPALPATAGQRTFNFQLSTPHLRAAAGGPPARPAPGCASSG